LHGGKKKLIPDVCEEELSNPSRKGREKKRAKTYINYERWSTQESADSQRLAPTLSFMGKGKTSPSKGGAAAESSGGEKERRLGRKIANRWEERIIGGQPIRSNWPNDLSSSGGKGIARRGGVSIP